MADKPEFKYLVRVANTDLDGNKQLLFALRKITGVNYMFANAVCKLSGINKSAKTGELSDAQVEKLNAIFKDPAQFPSWLKNRQNDYETGEDQHLLSSDLVLTKDNDIKRLKMIKSNRGLRHQWGLPLRGQRTKSNFRHEKMKASRNKKRK